MCTSFSSHPPSSTASTGCQMKKRGVLLKERRKLWSRHPGTDRDDWCLTYQTWIFWVNETLIILWLDISKRGGFGMRIFAGGLALPIGLQSFQWLSRGKPFNVNPVHLWNWDCTAAAPNKAEVFRFPDVSRFSVTVAELAKLLLVVPCVVEQHH